MWHVARHTLYSQTTAPLDAAAGIRRWYERATNADLPLQALAELEALRKHLLDWRDQLVLEARTRGASFTEIAPRGVV